MLLLWGNLIYHQVVEASWLVLPLALIKHEPSELHQLHPSEESPRRDVVVDHIDAGMKR